MPIYEYECGECKGQFEELVRSMSDTAARKCPKCGSGKTRRVLSVFKAGAAPAEKSFGDGASCGRCGGIGPCGGGMDD
jgi:putative FmdB family regulatory protein